MQYFVHVGGGIKKVKSYCILKLYTVSYIQGVKKFRIQTLRVCRGDKTKPFCYLTNIWQVLRFLARGLEGFDAGWFDCIQPAVWWMFYRSCWKYHPFTLMHSWHLRANDCLTRSEQPGVSLIIAAVSATQATSSSGVSIDILYTERFMSPRKRNP